MLSPAHGPVQDAGGRDPGEPAWSQHTAGLTHYRIDPGGSRDRACRPAREPYSLGRRRMAAEFMVALLHVMEEDGSERVTFHRLLAGRHDAAVAELAREFPAGRWAVGAGQFIIEDWRRSISLHAADAPRRHRDADGGGP